MLKKTWSAYTQTSKTENNCYTLAVNLFYQKSTCNGVSSTPQLWQGSPRFSLDPNSKNRAGEPQMKSIMGKKSGKGGLLLSTSYLQAINKTTLWEAGNEGRTQRSHHVPTLDLLSKENNSQKIRKAHIVFNNIYTSLKGKQGHPFVTTLSSFRVCISRHSNHFLI